MFCYTGCAHDDDDDDDDDFHAFSFAKGGEGENGRLDLPLVLPLSSPPPLLSCSLLDTGE